ncbi:porin [bacterium]|nr:MAG: porin [bacterium]
MALSLTGHAVQAQEQTAPAVPVAPASAQPTDNSDLKILRDEIAELREELRKLKEANAPTPPGGTPAAGTSSPTPIQSTTSPNVVTRPQALKWYDNITLRGYTQVRYNRLFETNPDLRNEQGDRSVGNNGGIFLRRMRLIFSGQVSKKVYFYVQPDFASQTTSTQLHYGQLRDAYFDLGMDDKNEFRLRVGQSKIPYGFENMQSSQNRLPLDRSDGINSSFTNERDLGVFFYYAPEKIRKRFADLVSSGLKGSGDYGVFGFGLFNGQTANRPELNNQQHFVARASYPFAIGKQIIEPGIQAYKGNFVIPTDQTSPGTIVNATRSYADERVAASFVLYPQPFGIQAEYNWGKGPEFNPATDTIETRNLHGGYVTFSYLTKLKEHTIIPFLRLHNYNGGKKHELDARSYRVREAEIGVEWQPNKNFELVGEYVFASRRAEDFVRQNNLQKGQLLRLQAQLNF